MKLFLGGRILNMPEYHFQKMRRVNRKRKDVHEILKATAAALCNVIHHCHCAYMCSCVFIYAHASHVYIYLSVFTSPKLSNTTLLDE